MKKINKIIIILLSAVLCTQAAAPLGAADVYAAAITGGAPGATEIAVDLYGSGKADKTDDSDAVKAGNRSKTANKKTAKTKTKT
ncbi:MAG: hypothetical protein IJH95_06815, partial [Mogibacterium sp.]|nr:hypothetical protein [Mogibacterium sp.]